MTGLPMPTVTTNKNKRKSKKPRRSLMMRTRLTPKPSRSRRKKKQRSCKRRRRRWPRLRTQSYRSKIRRRITKIYGSRGRKTFQMKSRSIPREKRTSKSLTQPRLHLRAIRLLSFLKEMMTIRKKSSKSGNSIQRRITRSLANTLAASFTKVPLHIASKTSSVNSAATFPSTVTRLKSETSLTT